jgi:2-C-methyl-D-erythritol 2,4-cyclodiphosphate synthase
MGHSDADVLTHAIMDALLGALGRGDIGQHFPDTDPVYRDQNSLMLLLQVMQWVKNEGYEVNNVDSTIVAEKPRLSPYIMAMKEKLSEVMAIDSHRISIKATTCEGMGFSGRQEGIEAYAVVSLSRLARWKQKIA